MGKHFGSGPVLRGRACRGGAGLYPRIHRGNCHDQTAVPQRHWKGDEGGVGHEGKPATQNTTQISAGGC